MQTINFIYREPRTGKKRKESFFKVARFQSISLIIFRKSLTEN